MNNKEKIITEIERRIGLFKKERINATPKSAGRISLDGRIAALEEILVFINSLSAEQQNDDLDDEIKLYQLRNPVINHNERSLNELIKRVATYFANWKKEQMMRTAIDALVDEDIENVGKKTLLLIGEQRDALNTQLSNYEYGEIVKLVVIKEEK